MDTRNPSNRAVTSGSRERGATSVQILVILVPVLFGFMGFAVDLGRLYLVRGELKAAANAMALAAAGRLAGTDASSIEAATAARLAIENSSGFGNKYDFGSVSIAGGNGNLSTDVPDPTFFESVAAALGTSEGGGGEASGSTAKHARVAITGEAPLTFWSFLSLGQERKARIAAVAVAGMSAPLCTACGIEPVAIQAISAGDTANFGLTPNTRYTIGYVCNGQGQPGLLANTSGRLNYVLLNRYDQEAAIFPDESTQAYRIGAAGLPGNANRSKACMSIDAAETIWQSATPLLCTQNRVPNAVQNFTCGLAERFDTTVPANCQGIPESDTIAQGQVADSDLSDLDDYAAYTGNQRRVITIAIVETLSPAGSMTVLGFRQFLLEPAQGDVTLNPTDQNGRFAALYIGSVVPLRQGAFSGCSVTAGPGKVVLHQ